MVFKAVIHKLEPLPNSEMAEIKSFEHLPENLTYPEITPELFRYLEENPSELSVETARMILQEAADCTYPLF